MVPPAAEGHGFAGLTAAEVAQRLERGQVNRAPRSAWAEYRDIFARNLFTLFNALVVPAAIALFVLHKYGEAWTVSAMAVINSIIGLVQEVRAKRHLDKLAILSQTRARVVRDGAAQTIPAGDVVLGDHVLLCTGEPVVADGPVLAERFLEVDEALLTGESDPVPRHAGDRLLSGSFCVAGDGVYRADKVGGESFANETSAQARQYHYAASPLQRSIDRIVLVLTGVTLVFCGLYWLAYFLHRFGQGELWQDIAATVTSMVPQGLVLLATLALTLGAFRMSARGAVVQRLSAVESMAGIDVLCMDKTGTLTTSRLRLDRLRPLGALSRKRVRERLRLFAWATLDERSKTIQALRAHLGEPAAADRPELLDQLPFKSQNRYSAVRIRSGPDERVLVLGACEALRPFLEVTQARSASAGGPTLARSASDGTTPEEDWEPVWRELLPTGLRLLLFAEARGAGTRNVKATFPPFRGTLQGFTLRPLALVALSDELREEAGAVLEALARQGIGFKILSGDNPETVRATVHNLELPLAHEPVVTGDELASSPDPARLIRTRSVFGRVAPRQKLDVVASLQHDGRQVAMIGDGINDILPIKRADLGIAMGEGAAATKTVAGLVLENNNFQLLPATLEEGRTLLANLRRASKLFLLKNCYTLILIVAFLLLPGLQFPYIPQQVTLLNNLTIGIPTFLITLHRERLGEPACRPSVLNEQSTFLGDVGWFVVRTGLIFGLAGLVMQITATFFLHDADRRMPGTLLLSMLILLGLGALWQVLRGATMRATTADRLLWAWLLLALPVYALAMYWRLLGDFFHLAPLGPLRWGLVLAVAAPALLLSLLAERLPWKELAAWLGRRRLPAGRGVS
jgi:cation-transporting ATPase E